MQLRHLSPEERDRRSLAVLCSILWVVQNPPTPVSAASRKQAGQVNLGGVSPGISSLARFLLPVQLSHNHVQYSCQTLFDTGAVENFISNQLVSELGFPVEVHDCPITVLSVDGRLLQPFPIRHRTIDLYMQIGEHVELVSFLVISPSATPLILGYPWFQTHGPHISWSAKRILQWGSNCHAQCLHPRPLSPSEVTAVPTIAIKDIPAAYRDLAEVFNKKEAAVLPPH